MYSVWYYLKHPDNFFLSCVYELSYKWFLNRLSDANYLKLVYYLRMKKKLNLKNPKTYNEKIQWLKLNDRNEIYTTMADKYLVKEYVSEKIWKEYIIPTLWVWDTFDKINFNKLPKSFVLKCTHDSWSIIIVKNKKDFNIKNAKGKLNKCLKRNTFYQSREFSYKNIKPKIIAEPYLEDNQYWELRDYKFFTFDGEVKLMFIATNRNSASETCFDFYDKNFNHLNIKNWHPHAHKTPKKPINYEKMVKFSEVLSKIWNKKIPHLRVDFYEMDWKLFFWELTFYHRSWMVPFEPEEWDYKLWNYIKAI